MYQKLLEADNTDTTESIQIQILETSGVRTTALLITKYFFVSNRGQDKNSEIKMCKIFHFIPQTELRI